jgi:hypothetical protein
MYDDKAYCSFHCIYPYFDISFLTMFYMSLKLHEILYLLGHPSFKIVSRVLRTHELPFVSNKASEAHVCDACPMAKSHQLPFPHSTSEPIEKLFATQPAYTFLHTFGCAC